MKTAQGANQRTQRIYNRSLLLEEVRRNRLISRIELSRTLGLKKSSISSIVGELVQHGLLVQQEQGASTSVGGRKPVFLSINEKYCSFLGLELQPNKFRAVVLDLAGNVLHRQMGQISTFPAGFEKTLSSLYLDLDPVVRGLAAPLAAVGVGIPGYVNPGTGMIFRSIPLGLTDFDFTKIPNPWGVPARVDNDAKCSAWAELIDADPRKPASFLVLLMEYQEENRLLQQPAGISVGFGVVINGDVYYGNDFSSGDFKSLFWRAGNKSQVGIPDERLIDVKKDRDTYDAYVEEVLLHLSPFISVFNPERIVFCGDAAPSREYLRDMCSRRIPDRYVAFPENADLIRISRHQEYGVALGASGRFLVSLSQPGTLSSGSGRSALDWQFLMAIFGQDRGKPHAIGAAP